MGRSCAVCWLLGVVVLVLAPGCVRTTSFGKKKTTDAGPDAGVLGDARSVDGFGPHSDLQVQDGPKADALGSTPKLGWSKVFGAKDYDYCGGVAVNEASGDLFATGTFRGTEDFGGGSISSKGADIFVVSYTSAGAYRWSKRLGGSGTESDGARDVAVGSAGHVYVTGYVESPAVDFGGGPLSGGSKDVFVASFSGDGAHRWSKRYANTFSSGGNYGSTVAVDGSGRVCVGGGYSGSIDFGGGPLAFIGDFNPFVLVLKPDGSHLWSVGADKGSGDFSGGGKATIAASGQVYLCGDFRTSISFGGTKLSSGGNSDTFIAGFSSSGTHTWLRQIGTVGSDWPYGIGVDKQGNIYLTGSFSGTLDVGTNPLVAQGSRDGFVVSFTPAGDHRWSKRLGGSGGYDQGSAVVLDRNGNIYVGGSFEGTIDLGGGPMTSNGTADLFVVSFSQTGAYRWSVGFGGVGTAINSDSLSDLAVDGAGGVYVGGAFQGTMSLSGTPLSMKSNGASDGFVLALKP